MRHQELAAELRRIPMLATLPAPLLDEFAALATTRPVAKGEVLFADGEAASVLPVLLSGQVKLYRAGPDGREQVLHLVRGPASFAEAAVFGPGIFPASAEVVVAGQIATISRASLLDLLRRRPEAALALLASLSMWLRRLVDLVDGLALHSVEERVAAYLWSVFTASGQLLRPGLRVRLEEPKHLIAALCGTAPEVLSRTFRKLEAERLVAIDGPSATLLDPAGLLARSGGVSGS